MVFHVREQLKDLTYCLHSIRTYLVRLHESKHKKMQVFVATEGRLHVRYITVDNLGAGPFCVSLWHYVSVAQHMQHRRARSSNDDPAEPYSAAE